MFGWIHEWAQLRKFRKLDASFREVVFYSEGKGDWPHLGPVIESLLERHEQRICFVTSDATDPGLKLEHERYRSFLIGSGAVRTVLFRTIECSHFVMTLVDLDRFHLKRSVHSVHYIYLFHSINSTHTVYREHAFDAYDTILCAGPHHVDEIRKTEARYGLRAKELIEHGSVKIDTVIQQCVGFDSSVSSGATRVILVAPSWGECSIIERPVGTDVIDSLVAAGYEVVLRLHPMTVRRLPELVNSIQRRYAGNKRFVLEEDMNAIESWRRSDLMISDWSGAAIEYAFATLKPVIYLNTAQKINNQAWQQIDAPSFEDVIRYEIGSVVELGSVAGLPSVIEQVCGDSTQRIERVLRAREKWIFNVGHSAEVAADYIASLAAPLR